MAEGGDNLRNRLREIRRKADITQEELARAVGTTRQTIHSIEREKLKKAPSYELMLSIANFFNMDVKDIFFADDVIQELHKKRDPKIS
jgi:putative transcriptional regulator